MGKTCAYGYMETEKKESAEVKNHDTLLNTQAFLSKGQAV